jgi:hypothetical protein
MAVASAFNFMVQVHKVATTSVTAFICHTPVAIVMIVVLLIIKQALRQNKQLIIKHTIKNSRTRGQHS